MSEKFEKFWNAYPRKEGKAACLKKWQQKNLDSRAEFIAAHVAQRAKDDKKWLDGYVPMPMTFLNQERWDDEYERVQPKTPLPSSKNSVVQGPWRGDFPQRDVHKATLNLSMLAAVMQLRGRVPVENLREAVRERNRMAAQFREMYGETMPQAEWAEMRKNIRQRFVDIMSGNA